MRDLTARQYYGKLVRDGAKYAGIKLTAAERTILADDLLAVVEELSDDDINAGMSADDVYAIWIDRLGGPRNMRPYVDTLIAGQRYAARIGK